MSLHPHDDEVKASRSYDSSRRRADARRRHAAVLASARRRFLDQGYGPTTVASIAADAGVSVDTVYKGFGGKSGLIRAIRADALEGSGSVPAEVRSDSLRSGEPHQLVEGWGRLLSEVSPLVAPILLLVRDAAALGDADMVELRAEADADRLGRMHDNARHLHDGGHLRPGVTLADATDVLWTYSAPELYELLVLRRGWSIHRYSRFAADAIATALLEDPRAEVATAQP